MPQSTSILRWLLSALSHFQLLLVGFLLVNFSTDTGNYQNWLASCFVYSELWTYLQNILSVWLVYIIFTLYWTRKELTFSPSTTSNSTSSLSPTLLKYFFGLFLIIAVCKTKTGEKNMYCKSSTTLWENKLVVSPGTESKNCQRNPCWSSSKETFS